MIDPERPTRTPEQAAMERLRDWLSCEDRPAVWSGSPNPNGCLPWTEVVAILAGIDPEVSASAGADGLSLLPGALSFYGFKGPPRDEAGRWNLNAGVAQQTALLAGLRLGTMRPAKAVSLVYRSGVPIPWLELALEDPECKKHLPLDVFKEGPKEQTGSFRESQRIKRNNQIEADDKRKLMDDLGYQVFLDLKARDYPDCRKGDGNVNKTKIAEKIEAAIHKLEPDDPKLWPKLRAITKRVSSWIGT